MAKKAKGITVCKFRRIRTVQSALILYSESLNVAMAVDFHDVPYVTYADYAYSKRASVMKFAE